MNCVNCRYGILSFIDNYIIYKKEYTIKCEECFNMDIKIRKLFIKN